MLPPMRPELTQIALRSSDLFANETGLIREVDDLTSSPSKVRFFDHAGGSNELIQSIKVGHGASTSERNCKAEPPTTCWRD